MLSNRILLTLSPVALALCASAPAFANERLQDFDVNQRLGLSHSELLQVRVQGELGGRLTAGVELDGQWYVMDLEPYSMRAEGFRVQEQRADGSYVDVDPGPVRTVRGSLRGAPGSIVAGALLDDGLYARIATGPDGDDHWLEPLIRHFPHASDSDYVLYTSSDVMEHDNNCGADLLAENMLHEPEPTSTTNSGSYNGGVGEDTRYIAEIACDADFEFYQSWGSSVSATQDRIEAVLTAMDLQYEQVEIRHIITTILVRSSSNDPYTTSNPGSLLSQVRTQWQNNHGGIQRDVVQMFTGRNLDGSVIGIAWLSAICGSFGYGVVQSNIGSFGCVTDLSAHELGHNWGADHCSCPNFTMQPSLGCRNKFAPNKTRPDIRNHRNSRTCLDTEPIGPGEEQFYFDGFESGGFAAGGWSTSSSGALVLTGARRTGSFGARIRNQGFMEKAQSTVGYATVRLKYSRRTKNLDSGENFRVEWYDGSSWSLVEELTTNVAWGSTSVLLPAPAGNNVNFRVRFSTDASQANERGDVDDVELIGE